jgi:2-polyprenyl-3-methyl-5-hydroxy-6-metoxy-1,4-benzoquinol methylase
MKNPFARRPPSPEPEGPKADGFPPLARATPRLDRLTGDDLAELNRLLKWNCFTVDSHGRRLGDRARAGKREEPQEIPDYRTPMLDRAFALADKHVLEIGCFEGVHTIGLCDRARAVTAIDSRIENVAKTVLRCYLYGHSPDIRRCNVEVADELAQLPDVDVVHHVGVLYHLVDPVAHLALLNRKVRLGLMLDTHVATAEQATETLISGGKQYPCRRFNEGGVAEVFSGMYAHASWLTLETLVALLKDLGFARTEVLEQRAERNGPRVLIMAHRNGQPG